MATQRGLHRLTDLQIRKARPRDKADKAYRLADGGGLFLFVAPSGTRSWQFRYRHNGRQQTATLGKLPTMSLQSARDAAQRARADADEGIHLTTAKRVRKAKKAGATATKFAGVAKGWIQHAARTKGWSDAHKAQVEASLRNHLSKLDLIPVSEITAPVVQPIIDAVQRRAPDMARKVEPRLHSILDHAVRRGMIDRNPLPRPEAIKRSNRNFPAVVDLLGVGAIMRAAQAAECFRGVRRAHALLVYSAQRVSEVVNAEWEEFDLDAALWTIPRGRMKIKDVKRGPHLVPLPPVLLALLKTWRREDGDGRFVMPALRPNRAITPEGIEKFYRDGLALVGKHSPHSWRSAFKTICSEAGKDRDLVESQLDHVVGDKVAAAYDRSKRLELRRQLMRWYEKTIIAARDGGEVVTLAARKI